MHKISSDTMMFYFSNYLILIVLTPSALLQENVGLKYELWNSDSPKDCRCNYTLDLVPICENKDVTYNRKEMSDCIDKCSKISTLNIIHNRECSQKSANQLSSKPIKECKDCKLTNEFAPVCGNDGVTYLNPSYLFCVADCEKPGLLYSHCGFCLLQDKEKSKDNEVMIDDNLKKVSKDLLDSLATCDCVIKYNLNPICGSDDRTYPNPSMLYCIKKCRKTDLQIKSCGKCPAKASPNMTEYEKVSKFTDTVIQCLASCPVPLDLNPVCGTNNKTFKNIARLKCYNSCTNETISVQHYGTCDKKCKCIADKDYNPVCGSDGNTYANPSTLFCAEECLKSDLKLSYCGKCGKQKELISGQTEAMIPDTLSKVFDACGCVFTKEYAPLCGTDGTVYSNPSVFYCTRKCMHSDITIKHCGDCNKNNEESNAKTAQQTPKNFKSLSSPFLKCDCVATSTLYPVCGTDGVTYPHPSYIYCTKNCKANDASADDLQMAYCGPCKEGGLELPKPDKYKDKLPSESLDIFEKCQCKITREWNPVCGTNNVTYSNPSIFYCSNKCIDPAIHIKHCGICHEKDNPKPLNVNDFDDDDDDPNKCRCTATREYKPVCGSDGNNYANFVILECIKNCTNLNIDIAYDGLCSDENKVSFITPNRYIRSAQISQTPDETTSVYARPKRNPQFKDPFQASMNKPGYVCNCPVKTNYDPVCGTDGKTYPNLSKLSCNWCYRRYIYIDHFGPCSAATERGSSNLCRCVVANKYSPVCGSDSETYPNSYQLNCANTCNNKGISKLYDGPCRTVPILEVKPIPQKCSCVSTYEYRPLCASNGKTYGNPSSLACFKECNNTNIYKVHDGPCKIVEQPEKPLIPQTCPCVSTYEYRPLCGSDGNSYNNPSELACANKCNNTNVYEVHNGRCNADEDVPPAKPPCECIINRTIEDDPFCGSDGFTYPNPSHLVCANRCNNTSVYRVHDGPCNKDEPAQIAQVRQTCDCSVTEEYEPLCGSDGKDYTNPSHLACFNKCNNTFLDIYKARDGPCNKVEQPEKPPIPQTCQCDLTDDYEPVCASDGIDYPNPSYIECVNKCKNTNIRKVSDGLCKTKPPVTPWSCRPCPLTASLEPFCGTDGEDYPNDSYLYCANQCNNNTKVYKAHTGRCYFPTEWDDPPLSKRCKCPLTYENSPLCATDGKTYRNLSQMHCANSCYKQNLERRTFGRCPKWTSTGLQYSVGNFTTKKQS